MTGAVLQETFQMAAAALVGVIGAAVTVRACDRAPDVSLTAAMVTRELAQAFPAFKPVDMLFDQPKRHKALILDQDARQLAIVFAFGKQIASRTFPADRARLVLRGHHLRLHLADLITPDFDMVLPDPIPAAFIPLFKQGEA